MVSPGKAFRWFRQAEICWSRACPKRDGSFTNMSSCVNVVSLGKRVSAVPPTDRSGKKSASFRGIASCASSDPSFNVMSLWRAPTNAASNSIVQTAKAYSSLLVIK